MEAVPAIAFDHVRLGAPDPVAAARDWSVLLGAVAVDRPSGGYRFQLDRGALATTTLRRSGTPTPPVADGQETNLFALGRPMRPRGFKFTARGAKK